MVGGKDQLTGHLLDPAAESSGPAPVFHSPGNSTQEWLPPRKRFGLVKLEGAGKPAPGAARAQSERGPSLGGPHQSQRVGAVPTHANQSQQTLPPDQHRPIGGRGSSGGENSNVFVGKG